MNVLIDTTVLSLSLRRQRPERFDLMERRIVAEFQRLAAHGSAVLIGLIRQEALSGTRTFEQFRRLQAILNGFNYLSTDLIDHDTAAEFYNRCRARGVAAGAIDMLVCASAMRHQLPILTTDIDFDRYAAILPIRLYDFSS